MLWQRIFLCFSEFKFGRDVKTFRSLGGFFPVVAIEVIVCVYMWLCVCVCVHVIACVCMLFCVCVCEWLNVCDCESAGNFPRNWKGELLFKTFILQWQWGTSEFKFGSIYFEVLWKAWNHFLQQVSLRWIVNFIIAQYFNVNQSKLT